MLGIDITDLSTLGFSVSETMDKILSLKSDIVEISAVAPTVKGAYRIARKIKLRSPRPSL